MRSIKTKHDGWGCNPDVKRIATTIKSFHDLTYEIENCVRISSMKAIRDDILFLADELREIADCLDVDVEYKTIDDE